MKLPMKIRVGYRTIEITYAKPDFKRDNMTDCFGQYLDRENRIEIQPGLSPKKKQTQYCMKSCIVFSKL